MTRKRAVGLMTKHRVVATALRMKQDRAAMLDKITARDKLACVEREFKMRMRVYPRLVVEGKMSAGRAELETKVMESIVADYRAQAEKERLL